MLDPIIYVSEYQPRKHFYTLQEGEKITLTVDWSAVADASSTAVSSVEWDRHSDPTISLSGEALANDKASALVSADNCGSMLLTNKATLADGQIRQVSIQISVKNPDVNY